MCVVVSVLVDIRLSVYLRVCVYFCVCVCVCLFIRMILYLFVYVCMCMCVEVFFMCVRFLSCGQRKLSARNRILENTIKEGSWKERGMRLPANASIYGRLRIREYMCVCVFANIMGPFVFHRNYAISCVGGV